MISEISSPQTVGTPITGITITAQDTSNDTGDPAYLIYTYRRSDAAHADPNTAIAVEYGSNLSGWTTAVHDGTNVIVSETDNFYGTSPGIDQVEVMIKRTLAAGGKLFARLKVAVP